jgi:hypothetical protein
MFAASWGSMHDLKGALPAGLVEVHSKDTHARGLDEHQLCNWAEVKC